MQDALSPWKKLLGSGTFNSIDLQTLSTVAVKKVRSRMYQQLHAGNFQE